MQAWLRSIWTEQPRLRRAGYWLRTLLVFFLGAVLSMMLIPAFFDVQGLERFVNDPDGMTWYRLAPFLIMLIVIGVVVTLLTTVFSVRRRRDQDRSGLDVVLYALLSLLIPIPGLNDMILRTIVDIGMGLWAIYLFFVLGFLPGTRGPNRYGPDPRAPVEATPVVAASGLKDTSPLEWR